MNKLTVLALMLCLLLSVLAAAEAGVEDRLALIVQSALEEDGLAYDYDAENGWFELSFSLDCALGEADVIIFLFDDMVSVHADCPLKVASKHFEQAAVFTTLANDREYYAQFRIDPEYGILTSRSCNVIESVLPTREEIKTLLYAPLIIMEDYGDGIAAVLTTDADPYDTFAACRAAMEQ